ncbi:hypothetical protein HPB47_019174 [Ixodes persulcatus]|uniref:Uncharacterized protein n=1 Tax=Ixodes persulcatus TaxID=34615 RepID=A0AC60QJQ0_IXOPE|nr:hypothetical protein HPB47_019174 [Ixodes persulcatus]
MLKLSRQSKDILRFDSRFGILEELAISEKEYNADLTGVYNLYAKPLKKLLTVHQEEHRALFDWVEPIRSVSGLMVMKETREKEVTSTTQQMQIGC